MKCIKEIKKEVFDEEKLRTGIHAAERESGDYVRIVMSNKTLNALRAEATVELRAELNLLHAASGSHRYYGIPIDINDGLAFGEVKFTTEVDV